MRCEEICFSLCESYYSIRRGDSSSSRKANKSALAQVEMNLGNDVSPGGQVSVGLLGLVLRSRPGTTKGLGAQKIHPSLVIFGSFGLLKGTTLSPASPSASTMHFANCLAASGPIACGSSF